MTQITDQLWLGTASDLDPSDHNRYPVLITGCEAVLNCAHDLMCIEFDVLIMVEYAHVGLVDGPGNSMVDYHAAMLKLCSMLLRGKITSVHDHDITSRSVAVVIMALHALHRRGWDHWLSVIREKCDLPLLTPHEQHFRAFNKINWRLVSTVLESR